MLTIFMFGYWGWGNATRQLIRAIDASERKNGFSPPVLAQREMEKRRSPLV